MPNLLVMVNGLPGSGKSTLGQALARNLHARFLSKDEVKEALAATVTGAGALPTLGAIAMDTIWTLAQAIPDDIVIDSWWFAPRDRALVRAGLVRAGAARTVEIWCDVPPEIARARYESRARPGFYRDREHLTNDWNDWVSRAEPLGLAATTIPIDTSTPVDTALLAERVRRDGS
ncbi:AAA family ATPase [Nocardia macrotermitis]|uniref:Kinase n=1 Tax=Nocardia macrotermitis TaxID=2585198 RepID=A0A7K0CVW0_9NOCA|nr:ATP-binding protein [Nocardia macrotermitis]MQY17122.1 hypothetical protein [Nocardia macrotermitis]